MNNFFLYNEAIDLCDLNLFKSGIFELILIEREKDDDFKRHETLWSLKIINLMYSNFGGQEEQVIYKFLEQLSPIEIYIDCKETFDQLYPNSANAFLGIEFSELDISGEVQVTNSSSFTSFKESYYSCIAANGDKEKMISTLVFLYPNYSFEDKAINDITYWNSVSPDLYSRLLELLHDIEKNPFLGGLGKTEVLKNKSGVASKRLDSEHRITYSSKGKMIRIHSCKGHYE